MSDKDSTDLTQHWRATQRLLPDGWSLDGLRCASTGLAPEQRSDDWIAVAVGPNGERREARSDDPVAALELLAHEFST